jgi:hypothetical protein
MLILTKANTAGDAIKRPVRRALAIGEIRDKGCGRCGGNESIAETALAMAGGARAGRREER